MKRFSRSRLILLATGILTILGLTGMHIYSLYALHESTVTSSVEKHKRQMEELTSSTRARFYQSVRDLWRVDMDALQDILENNGAYPNDFLDIMMQASSDPLFHEIYFMDARSETCNAPNTLKKFSSEMYTFPTVDLADDLICDGLSMARTRMRVLVQEYKWNTRIIHDSHRTMTIVMFNPTDRQIVSYIIMRINQEYLINGYLAPEINARFGTSEDTGVIVWLDYWTKRQVIASNGALNISRDRPDYIQRFSNMLEDWHLRIIFQETPEILASKASLRRNLIFLGAGFFLLMGSLIFMYITAQKERELGIRQASFLANVTHELKTPLAVMQAAGENLSDGRVTTPERLKSYGKHIYSESLRLRRMIDKLLDVAKNEAGQLVLKQIPSDLSELIKDYIYEHETFLNSIGANIDLKIDTKVPEVMIDHNSFHTILGNLVENALKYSPNSKYVGIELLSDNKNVYLNVKDYGSGIPKDKQKLIFEKFYRVEDTLTAHTKGHGLGLSIVKNLVERNGGYISVESEYGKGSEFTVSFPALSEMKRITILNGKQNELKQKEYVV